MQYEYRFLNAGVKHIITDSPVILSSIYAHVYFRDLNIAKPLEELADIYEKSHPSINIFLKRQNKPYIQEGRYQTYEEAKAVDEMIHNMLLIKQREGWNVKWVDYNDRKEIMRIVSDVVPEFNDPMD